MKRSAFSVFVLVASVAALCLIDEACLKHSDGWKGKTERRGRITVVKNPGEPLYPPGIFRLEKELSIGQAEGEKAYAFSRIGGIDVDPEGAVYVIDRGEASVRVFDANGQFLRSIGRKGQGPGETEMPVFAQITSRNELFVYDYATCRAIFYSLDGKLLSQKPAGWPLLPVKLDSQGNLVGIEILAPPPLGGKLLKRYDANFILSLIIARGDQGRPEVIDLVRPTCFCCVLPDDRIVWGNSKDYVLHVLDASGAEIMTIEKTHHPRKMTSVDEARYREIHMDAVKHGYRLEFYDHFPAFSGIFADDGGRIFVKTYERVEGKSEETYYDVFDADGRYAVKVPLSVDLAAGSVWKKHKLYAIESDGQGFPVVNRYGVSWTK